MGLSFDSSFWFANSSSSVRRYCDFCFSHRFYHLFLEVNCQNSERTFASYYHSDYERKKRHFIVVIIISYQEIMCTIIWIPLLAYSELILLYLDSSYCQCSVRDFSAVKEYCAVKTICKIHQVL